MEMTIQQLAKLAKNRIKTGYWKQECNMLSSNVNNIDSEADKAMYDIVASILESDEVVTNPLNKIIDTEYYESLNDEARSRYMLDLSRQYVRMTEKYAKMKNTI